MKKKSYLTESEFIERTRIALTNAETHVEIKPLIGIFGMDESKIAEGWTIFNSFLALKETQEQEGIEKKTSSDLYSTEFSDFISVLKKHRDQCLIFFKKHPEFLVKLGVKGSFPTKNDDILDFAKHFYKSIKKHAEIQEKLSLCMITPEIVEAQLTKLETVKQLRADYYKESGEAQDATVNKKLAYFEIKDWMEDFDIIAKSALYAKPQLLEVLGIFVRS